MLNYVFFIDMKYIEIKMMIYNLKITITPETTLKTTRWNSSGKYIGPYAKNDWFSERICDKRNALNM